MLIQRGLVEAKELWLQSMPGENYDLVPGLFVDGSRENIRCSTWFQEWYDSSWRPSCELERNKDFGACSHSCWLECWVLHLVPWESRMVGTSHIYPSLWGVMVSPVCSAMTPSQQHPQCKSPSPHLGAMNWLASWPVHVAPDHQTCKGQEHIWRMFMFPGSLLRNDWEAKDGTNFGTTLQLAIFTVFKLMEAMWVKPGFDSPQNQSDYSDFQVLICPEKAQYLVRKLFLQDSYHPLLIVNLRPNRLHEPPESPTLKASWFPPLKHLAVGKGRAQWWHKNLEKLSIYICLEREREVYLCMYIHI